MSERRRKIGFLQHVVLVGSGIESTKGAVAFVVRCSVDTQGLHH